MAIYRALFNSLQTTIDMFTSDRACKAYNYDYLQAMHLYKPGARANVVVGSARC